MLTEPILARNIKLEFFEQPELELLQAELAEWLGSREQEDVVGISFDTVITTGESAHHHHYVAYVLYTE